MFLGEEQHFLTTFSTSKRQAHAGNWQVPFFFLGWRRHLSHSIPFSVLLLLKWRMNKQHLGCRAAIWEKLGSEVWKGPQRMLKRQRMEKNLQMHSPEQGAPASLGGHGEEPIPSLALTEKRGHSMDVSPGAWLVKNTACKDSAPC